MELLSILDEISSPPAPDADHLAFPSLDQVRRQAEQVIAMLTRLAGSGWECGQEKIRGARKAVIACELPAKISYRTMGRAG
jgi:hypothetical protein